MKVTRTLCTKSPAGNPSRKHNWKTVSKEYKADGKVYYVYAWCCQCGCLTEFVQEGNTLERVLDKDNEYLITKPETVL